VAVFSDRLNPPPTTVVQRFKPNDRVVAWPGAMAMYNATTAAGRAHIECEASSLS